MEYAVNYSFVMGIHECLHIQSKCFEANKNVFSPNVTNKNPCIF